MVALDAVGAASLEHVGVGAFGWRTGHRDRPVALDAERKRHGPVPSFPYLTRPDANEFPGLLKGRTVASRELCGLWACIRIGSRTRNCGQDSQVFQSAVNLRTSVCLPPPGQACHAQAKCRQQDGEKQSAGHNQPALVESKHACTLNQADKQQCRRTTGMPWSTSKSDT